MNDRAWAEQVVSKAGQQQENKEGNFSCSNVAVVHNCSTGKRETALGFGAAFFRYELKRYFERDILLRWKHDVQLLLKLLAHISATHFEQLFACRAW